MEKFIALDFETSKGKHACSIGIVEFENGKVKSEYYSLIKPYDLEFGYYNQKIHGITLQDVANEKTFDFVWNEISHYFKGTKIVAHNYSTDISVLKYNLELYGLEMPVFDIYCTLRLSRKLISLKSYKLSDVAKYFGVSQNNYHNALEDSYVCGEIMNHLFFNFKDSICSIENQKK